jgi:cytochrome P450
VPYGFVGWGVGRHPCLGMRFAKLEINVIVAHFLAMFGEYHLCNRAGEGVQGLPKVNLQGHAASKPDRPIYLKVRRGEK